MNSAAHTKIKFSQHSATVYSKSTTKHTHTHTQTYNYYPHHAAWGLREWGLTRRFIDTNHISREYQSKSGLVSFLPTSLYRAHRPLHSFAPPKDELTPASPEPREPHRSGSRIPRPGPHPSHKLGFLYHERRVVNHVFGNGRRVGPVLFGNAWGPHNYRGPTTSI